MASRHDTAAKLGSAPDELTCPEGRVSKPTRRRGGRDIVDIDTYIPYFLTSVNNALSRGASARYLAEFGIGIFDWRLVSMLAIEPRIPAHRACQVVSLDKAQVSRSLKKMREFGLVDFETAEGDPRRKIWWLTDRGYDLHDRILRVALERERALIEGADPDDLEAFLRVIRIMRRNVEKL